MVENEPSSSKPQASVWPTTTLLARSSMDNFFVGGPGASPGPMTLVSSFFAENDPEIDYRSFSQLVVDAMSSPTVVSNVRRDFPPWQEVPEYKESAGKGGGKLQLQSLC
ncbi:putative WRKY transcription factor 3 [Forsythia ovata]|uniref:WRKY transcription factor 3 n=1 Tax=Forsythia ovata TaxID=205694 RepID=A0ABD1X4J9_9LAMI